MGLAPDGRVPRILLAEDDPHMRDLLASGLRRRGYQVVEAPNGSALLFGLFTHVDRGDEPPDLVVSDVRMPGLSGLAALRELRGRSWGIPMVLITAFGDADLHAEATSLGARVLDKPFDLDDLYRMVASALAS